MNHRRSFLVYCASLAMATTGCLRNETDGNNEPTQYQNKTPTQGIAANESVTAQVETTVAYADNSGPQTTNTGYRRVPEQEQERTPSYDFSSNTFKKWAQTECPSLVADYVRDVLKERLGTSLEGISVGVEKSNETWSATVSWIVLLNQEGDVIHEPTVGFEKVIQETPQAVRAVLIAEQHRHECTIPVMVKPDIRRET